MFKVSTNMENNKNMYKKNSNNGTDKLRLTYHK
jgi:hypothetical protein